MYSTHGMKANIRHRIETTYCVCCLSEFFSCDRLVRHLSQGVARPVNVCHVYYNEYMPKITKQLFLKLECDATVHAAALKKKGRNRWWAERPTQNILGPRPKQYYCLSFMKAAGQLRKTIGGGAAAANGWEFVGGPCGCVSCKDATAGVDLHRCVEQG